jgi:hypothetical protein
MGQYLNKPTGMLPASSSAPLCPSGEWPTLFPALVEFLTLAVWEDGTSRLPGSLTLFVDNCSWKVCLHCKDTARVGFVSSSSAEGALQAAEDALVRSTLDWRPAGRNGTRRART